MVQTLQAFLRKLFTVLTLFFVMVLWGGTADLYSQQVWTYDFGDLIDQRTTGDITTFITQNQSDGGTLRVRVSGSNDGRDITISDVDNEIGTFSRMILDAAATGGRNIFEIHSFDATDVAYLRATIKISAAGENNLEIFIGNDESAGNALSLSNVVAGFRFSIEEDEENELFIELEGKRGTGSAVSSAQDFNLNPVLLDTKHVIEIYINNSLSDLTYVRNGEQFPLNSDRQAYWLDGDHLASGFGTTNNNHDGSPLDLEENISTIRFLGGDTGGDHATMEIDDIVYSNSLPDLRTIDGSAGWRMLASPYDGFNVDQLSRQNLVQGITVGDYDNVYSGNDDNVYTSYDGTDWVAANNVSNPLYRGNGFIWFMHDDETGVVENKPLPLDIYSTGTQVTENVTVDLRPQNPEEVDGWNLLGNPFSEDLDVINIESWAQGNIANATVQIWDGESYVASTANDDKVAAFQGFFLENDDATKLEIPANATTDGANFHKTAEEASRLIALKLEGSDEVNSYTDRAFTFYFHENAENGWDLWDASKLTPLLNNYVNIAFVGQRDNETRLKAQESRPYNPNNFEVPARLISAGVNGTFTLGINKKVNIPDGWILEVTDHKTGVTTDLMENDYQFDVASNHAAKNLNGSKIAPEVATMNKAIGDDRFTFQVITGESAPVDPDNDLPDHVALEQNYPNPFNPATVINYDIPEQSHVRLAVYDLIGRQVDLLVNETRAAGSYNITWDGSQLSSGVYIYRLETAGQTLTRQMTLIK